jgi:hypothetical protein
MDAVRVTISVEAESLMLAPVAGPCMRAVLDIYNPYILIEPNNTKHRLD